MSTEPASGQPGPDSLSVVVPMYNEEENAPRAIESLMDVLSRQFSDFEIVIVESGSTDGTAPIADDLAGRFGPVRVIHQANREGLGSAIRLGFANAACDYVLYVDGDEPFDISEISRVMPLLDGCDMVIGYRIGPRENLKRKVYSRVYNFLVQLLLRLNVRDVNFSMKILRREVLRSLDLRADGCFYDAELIAEARRQGLEIRELGFRYVPRTSGDSSLDRLPVILNILREMAGYILRKRILHR
jgi:glycosyltransferase involved in cell wall biosynthesis